MRKDRNHRLQASRASLIMRRQFHRVVAILGLLDGLVLVALITHNWEQALNPESKLILSICVVVFVGSALFSLYIVARFTMQQSPMLITRAPGAALQRFAQLWFSKKVCGLIFEQILCDLQMEYFEALAEHDPVKARFVLARGYGAFWCAFVMQLPVSLGKVIVELWLASK